MTIKLTLGIEPVDETVEVYVTRYREGKLVFESNFVAPVAPHTSPVIEMEADDELKVALKPAHQIVFDKEQFVARVEDLNAPEIAHRREAQKKAVEEAEKAVEEDKRLRFKEGERIDQQLRKEAREAERPVRATPAVPPLPEKRDEQAENHDTTKVPPKGGAKDSKEVKKEA